MPLWVVASHLPSTIADPLLCLPERARRERSYELAWQDTSSQVRTCMPGVLSSLVPR